MIYFPQNRAGRRQGRSTCRKSRWKSCIPLRGIRLRYWTMKRYISIPRDLTRVKSKVLFNLTKRQLICFGAAALIGVPFFFLLKAAGNVSLAALGMILVMLPLFFLAMYEKDGQPLEVVAKHFIQAKFLRPKVRPYQTDNYYAAVLRQYEVYREVEEIVQKAEEKSDGKRKNTCKFKQVGKEADQTGGRKSSER